MLHFIQLAHRYWLAVSAQKSGFGGGHLETAKLLIFTPLAGTQSQIQFTEAT